MMELKEKYKPYNVIYIGSPKRAERSMASPDAA
jgi:uncharacterized protein (DUF302 family)